MRVFDLDHGQARLLADLPATLAHAIHDRLTRMAEAVRGGSDHDGAADMITPDAARSGDDRTAAVDDRETTVEVEAEAPFVTGSPSDADDDAVDDRTLDQLRADILCDLVLAGGAMAHGDGLEAITGHVQVTIPARSLATPLDAGSVRVGLLAGGGAADAESVRCLAATAPGWDRVLTDPLSGAVLGVDRCRPSAELKRFLMARDEICRFPGCRRAARGCDIDHTLDAAHGGPTQADNLAHLCRRHHTLKHESAWTVRQRRGGVIEWRSPLGHRYSDRPPAVVRFVPIDADPPPF